MFVIFSFFDFDFALNRMGLPLTSIISSFYEENCTILAFVNNPTRII